MTLPALPSTCTRTRRTTVPCSSLRRADSGYAGLRLLAAYLAGIDTPDPAEESPGILAAATLPGATVDVIPLRALVLFIIAPSCDVPLVCAVEVMVLLRAGVAGLVLPCFGEADVRVSLATGCSCLRGVSGASGCSVSNDTASASLEGGTTGEQAKAKRTARTAMAWIRIAAKSGTIPPLGRR